MASPDPSLEGLPLWLQYTVQAVIFLAAAFGVIYGYLKRPKVEPATSKDIVLTAAGLVDLDPIRALVEQVEKNTEAMQRVAAVAEDIREIMKQQVIEDEVQRRVREHLARMKS